MERDKVKGMLWGLIVGDALGSPIQFTDKDNHPWITEMEYCPVFNVPAGFWTDDGSMAMCIMDSFVRKGDYDLNDVAETFVRWIKDGYLSSIEGRAFDIGNATFASLSKFSETGSLVNGEESSQGNGSLMRLAPSYIIARALNRPEIVREVSDVTHASNRVRETCDVLALVLDLHMAGGRSSYGPGSKTPREKVPNSGWCVDSLNAAMWAFNTTNTFEEGMIAAVNLGGDSDSIGAVYGQIAGAYYGFDAIPERWVKAVKTWEKVDVLIEKFLDAVEKKSVFPKVLDLIRQTKKVSVSYIQSELGFGYNLATRMLDWLKEEGYVSLVENHKEVLDKEGSSFTDAYKINWEKF
jgi:ADP-ribosyl-[dinitrogen reductase] hydrolase